MKVLLIGSGGREHALAWKIAQSDRCEALYCAPGNPGIEQCAECVDIAVDDPDGLVAFAKEKHIDLVVIGPEAPLVDGFADRLRGEDISVFGPSAAAAQLEGSKGFMKDLCAKYDVPTAGYGRFTALDEAKSFIRNQGAPIVVKTDGLAAGKGVIICQSVEEAEQAAAEMLSGDSFGDAGQKIVIEQFLEGEEVSFFALADGKTVIPLISAQDHKCVGEGDTGPNTGGMGAYCPAHLMNEELGRKIFDRTIVPIIEGMKKEGCPFTGVLFAGLMVKDGEPTLLEYNIRFGDPECQAIMMHLDCDVLEILAACAQGRLHEVEDRIRFHYGTALCVVMAAEGYPGSYVKNTLIRGLSGEEQADASKIFHAGTGYDDHDRLVNIGGRVLGVTAQAETVVQAQKKAYEAIEKIDWPEGFCRYDIGWRAVEVEQKNNAVKKSVA